METSQTFDMFSEDCEHSEFVDMIKWQQSQLVYTSLLKRLISCAIMSDEGSRPNVLVQKLEAFHATLEVSYSEYKQ